MNAALFSRGDLTITGTGSLSVTPNGNDAIASKDRLVVECRRITVAAVDDGHPQGLPRRRRGRLPWHGRVPLTAR